MDEAESRPKRKPRGHLTKHSSESYEGAVMYYVEHQSEGLREVGKRFGIAPSNLSRAVKRHYDGNPIAPKPLGGSRPYKLTEEIKTEIVDALKTNPLLTYGQVRPQLPMCLAAASVSVSFADQGRATEEFCLRQRPTQCFSNW